jgi:hypothetical protein
MVSKSILEKTCNIVNGTTMETSLVALGIDDHLATIQV